MTSIDMIPDRWKDVRFQGLYVRLFTTTSIPLQIAATADHLFAGFDRPLE